MSRFKTHLTLAVLIVVFLISTVAVDAEVCSSPCRVRGGFSSLEFEDTDTGAAIWRIQVPDDGAKLEFGTTTFTHHPFVISGAAYSGQLIVDDQGGVLVNRGGRSGLFTELAIGGATSAAANAALALSPKGPSIGQSGRISVGPSGFNFTVRSIEADDFNTVISVSTSATDNGLTIDASGDVGVSGVGVANIIDDFHVGGGQVYLDPSGNAGDWQLNPNGVGFWLVNEDGAPTTPFKVTNNAATDTLVVDTSGVGVGTALPSEDLDIRSLSPTIALTDVSGNRVNRIWEINSSSDSGRFDIRDVTAGTSPLTVFAGSLDNALLIDSSGVTLSSSRSVKRGIEPIDPAALLDELAELPIYSWSYISDESGSLHVGPMAEDFYRRFGLGPSEKRISSINTSGVALAAIQALHRELEKRDAEIAELRAAVERLLAERGK